MEAGARPSDLRTGLRAARQLVFRPLIGMGLDRFGRKAFFVAGLLGYALAMLLFSQADSLGSLYIARLVNGIAFALTMIATRTMIINLAPAGTRGWPLIFSGYALFAAASAWIAWRRVPETRPAAASPDKRVDQPVSRIFVRLLVIIFTSAVFHQKLCDYPNMRGW